MNLLDDGVGSLRGEQAGEAGTVAGEVRTCESVRMLQIVMLVVWGQCSRPGALPQLYRRPSPILITTGLGTYFYSHAARPLET